MTFIFETSDPLCYGVRKAALTLGMTCTEVPIPVPKGACFGSYVEITVTGMGEGFYFYLGVLAENASNELLLQRAWELNKPKREKKG